MTEHEKLQAQEQYGLCIMLSGLYPSLQQRREFRSGYLHQCGQAELQAIAERVQDVNSVMLATAPDSPACKEVCDMNIQIVEEALASAVAEGRP